MYLLNYPKHVVNYNTISIVAVGKSSSPATNYLPQQKYHSKQDILACTVNWIAAPLSPCPGKTLPLWGAFCGPLKRRTGRRRRERGANDAINLFIVLCGGRLGCGGYAPCAVSGAFISRNPARRRHMAPRRDRQYKTTYYVITPLPGARHSVALPPLRRSQSLPSPGRCGTHQLTRLVPLARP